MRAEHEPAGSRRVARETRLLVLTLVISAVVLVLLARFRFPDGTQRLTAPPATALDALATFAAFDAQASALRDVTRRLEGSLVNLRWRAARPAPDSPSTVSLTGLRIRDDLAVAAFPSTLDVGPDSIEAFVESRWLPVTQTGSDHARGLVVVRIPARQAPVLSIGSQNVRTPGYLAAARGGPSGPSLGPLWVGALAAIERSAWDGPVWALPENVAATAAGPLLFSIDGTLVGVVSDGPAGTVLVPADLALGRAGELARGRTFTGADAGFDVVDLGTPGLRAAVGRSEGALVGWVDPAASSHVLLHTGDVIVRVDADVIRDSVDFARAMARREPGSRVAVTLVRFGQELSVAIVLRTPPRLAARSPRSVDGAGRAGEIGLGLTLRQAGEAVLVVSVDPRGPAADALEPGDRITWLRGHPQATPPAIAKTYDALPSGGSLLLRVANAGPRPRSLRAAPERPVAILKP